MVDSVKKYVLHPLIISAICCAILLYTRCIPCKGRNPYTAVVPVEAVCRLTGVVSSNPSISGTGDYYSSAMSLVDVSGEIPLYANEKEKTTNRKIVCSSNAKGLLPVQFTAAQIESYAPGKLFSLSKKGMLIETGALISCDGSWSAKRNTFIVNSISSCSYAKTLTGKIAFIRALSRLFFKRLMFSWGDAGALILSLLAGSRDFLDKSVRDGFKNAGLSHILALSGMHLSFFSGIAGKAGRRFFGKKHTFIPQVISILLFVWFAGLSPSLFRALLCSLAMLVASSISYRGIDVLEVLAGAFLVHVVVFPSDMFTAAFMLSYGALAGILTIGTVLKRPCIMIFTPKVAESLSASIGAQVATAPVSILLFGELMPIGIIASSIVSPFIIIFLSIALLCILFSLCMPFLSPMFGCILNVIYKVIVFLVTLFSKAPTITVA